MGPDGWLEQYTFPSERDLGSDGLGDGLGSTGRAEKGELAEQERREGGQQLAAARARAVYERCVGRTLQVIEIACCFFFIPSVSFTAHLLTMF